MAKKDVSATLSADFQSVLDKTKYINVEVNNEVK
jgi:hypothetical protein